ncbi:hypothetical protein ACHAWF_015472 [Thalassiosira exigua]
MISCVPHSLDILISVHLARAFMLSQTVCICHPSAHAQCLHEGQRESLLGQSTGRASGRERRQVGVLPRRLRTAGGARPPLSFSCPTGSYGTRLRKDDLRIQKRMMSRSQGVARSSASHNFRSVVTRRPPGLAHDPAMKVAAASLLLVASRARAAGLRGSSGSDALLVDYVYTYGAPAAAKHPHHANPGNRCLPGIRVYTKNFGWPSWAFHQGVITNTDFASHINAAFGYGHPKISTLALRDVEGGKREYLWYECKDEDNKDYYDWEWYPSKSAAANAIPGFHIHSIDTEYEPRLKAFFDGTSVLLAHGGATEATDVVRNSPLLNYTSVAWCNGMPLEDTKTCLSEYGQDHPTTGGVAPLGWEVDAQMEHITEGDSDRVYTLRNDADPNFRRCIISFQQSREIADFGVFFKGATTGYCGRDGVHIGLRNELWQLTHNAQWASEIKPSLEKCHEVTCVGHSLGGALCNVFTMCANTGPEYLVGNTDAGMQDDYDALVWTKARTATVAAE